MSFPDSGHSSSKKKLLPDVFWADLPLGPGPIGSIVGSKARFCRAPLPYSCAQYSNLLPKARPRARPGHGTVKGDSSNNSDFFKGQDLKRLQSFTFYLFYMFHRIGRTSLSAGLLDRQPVAKHPRLKKAAAHCGQKLRSEQGGIAANGAFGREPNGALLALLRTEPRASRFSPPAFSDPNHRSGNPCSVGSSLTSVTPEMLTTQTGHFWLWNIRETCGPPFMSSLCASFVQPSFNSTPAGRAGSQSDVALSPCGPHMQCGYVHTVYRYTI